MKLLTKEIENNLRRHPIYSQDGKGLKAELVVKFFLPSGAATWLITEGEKKENGDWELFGYATIDGSTWEWGYVMLSMLEAIRDPVFHLPVERDLYAGVTVEDEVR